MQMNFEFFETDEPLLEIHKKFQRGKKGVTMPTDPTLLWILHRAADEWGALGVAQAATEMVPGYRLARVPESDVDESHAPLGYSDVRKDTWTQEEVDVIWERAKKRYENIKPYVDDGEPNSEPNSEPVANAEESQPPEPDMSMSERVLRCSMNSQLNNSPDAETIGDYLRILLITLWTEQEDFSGKKPLGNSDWPEELYEALHHHGFIEAHYDEDDEFFDISNDERYMANKLVASAINFMFQPYVLPKFVHPISPQNPENLDAQSEPKIVLPTSESIEEFVSQLPDDPIERLKALKTPRHDVDLCGNKIYSAIRTEAIRVLAQGVSEYLVCDLSGVSRTTIRKWQGK